ncbi:hypothetical protein D9M73_255940 [compost metagenome]
MSETPQPPTLEHWQTLYVSQKALIESPERHRYMLIELAESLKGYGLIDSGELTELLEGFREQWNRRPT